ncbi:cadherin-like domain-containing protein [Gammaproteobacteria bacterium]|nr:cadherin-like domain-containing protein [Gammaproteobacteria bacterium]
MNKFSLLLPIIFIISSCGGGGGGGGSTSPVTPITPAPTVNLSADPVSVLLDNTSTLTWSSTNATSCSASWTTQTSASGSETVSISSAGNNTFSISCTGAGGSKSVSVTVEGYRNTDGVVVDGYISGAEVCIDEDESWTCNSDESTTISDNDGKFTIKYANGSLISIGGTDLDSQTLLDNLLITHKLTGHSDFKAVTPVTSVAAFMTDATNVNAALGIDSSIDVSIFDPVANKGDGGINNYLYEKGNQLTVLAYALQNITNNLNTTTETTQDYFKAITEELEKEYTETTAKVDIETEDFITKTVNNIIEAKTLTITDAAKANATKALSGVMPVIEVKSTDDLTTSVIRFAVSTLQTDIQAIANGTASDEIIASYTGDILNYIAEDQNIDSGNIAPSVTAVADSASTLEDTSVTINVLANDSYLTSSPISIVSGNGSNGTTLLAESSPEQVVYTPNADFNGTDIFSYSITQGSKTSSANVSVIIEATNDKPSINTASVISILEDETAITTISIFDIDGDELTLSIEGVDANSFNLSNENVLSLKEAASYADKPSYSITLSLTDGTETVTKNITVSVIKKGEYTFEGKTIDGYIEGAEVYLDQNFNFRLDDGEISSTTNSDGSFNISTDDLELYNCLKSRPIVANVPVGAIDSSLGDVTKAYRMVLPSINDTGNSSIVISPFTSLLGDAVIQAKRSSSITDELTLVEGCGNIGNSIASSISNELTQIKDTLSTSLNISYDDLVIDFIADTSSSIITETSAQNIAKFFPYFKDLTDEFDSELSIIHDKTINTDVTIERDSINSILANSSIEEIPVSFSAIYKTEPNDQGWFIREKITAFGAKLSNTGEMKHYTCFGDSDNCSTSDISLVSLRDASERYTRTSSFINNNYNPSTYNYQLVVEDEQRVDFDFDGNPSSRICILQNWLYLVPVNQKENFTTSDRYNTGVASGSEGNDKCVEELSGKDEALFVALVDQYDDGVNFEEIDIRIRNADYSKSTFFTNKLNDVYNNRSNINVDPLIQEIASVPRTFKAMNILRDKLSTTSTDVIRIYWTKRNSSSQITESSMMLLSHNPDNDNFEYATYENSDTGSIRTEVINSSGQQARDDLFSTINSKSKAFNNSEFNGLSAVTDQRTSLTGKTIDGYISGATVFFDVNFNQRLDAGEYSAITDASGGFEIKVNDSDLECVKARPIVANVPIGAEDSTLGTVNKSYQMLLPSVNDAGSNQVVISPFTSLLAEAILKGKAESDISEDLSVFEGCQAVGNNVASRISSEVNSMINLIENTYGINWEDLISDFIESGGTSKISESLAAKIAGFFPYYKDVKDEIASELSTKFEKDVTPNVSLSENSLNSILSTGEFDELPLQFFSVYKTNKNSAGWYQVEEMSASNSYISSDGKLSREHCSETDTIGCNIDKISLQNVANASTIFQKQSNFFNNDITIDGLESGSLAVYAFEERSWREQSVNWQNNRARECQTSDDIQFQVVDENNMLKNFHYSSYSQGYALFDCQTFREYFYPKLNIATIFNGDQADNSIQVNYYIPDILRSGIIQNAPYDFVQNRLTIDPTDVIKEMADMQVFYKDVNAVRSKLVGDEYVLFEYHADPNITYFEMGTSPRNDYYSDNLQDGKRGQAARDAFFEKLKTEETFGVNVYGQAAPINDSIIGRIGRSSIEIVDYKNSTEIILPVYPVYDSSTKTLNMSLINSELNIKNIKDFLGNGINSNPLNAKMFYHPDDTISASIPIVLYLFEGDDTNIDTNEAYFSIEFSIDVISELNSDFSAKQTFELKAGQVIKAKFTEDGTTITRDIVNVDSDKVVVQDDERTPVENPITQPNNLQLKLLKIISSISDDISSIQNFFKNGETYTYKIDFGSGGFSFIDYERNTVEYVEGSFTVSENPTYAINVDNMEIKEGDKANLCFYRSSMGDLSATTMDLSFTQRERPGRGAFADDFSLSSNKVSFAENDTEACIEVTGTQDNHFDWFHDAYLDISEPTNGQKLSRDRVKIRIKDEFGAQNRIGWFER